MRKGENIFKRKDGRYEARYVKGRTPNGRAVYGYVYGKSYSEVKKKRADTLLQTAKPHVNNKKHVGFELDKILTDWLNEKQKYVKPSTLAKYRTIISKYIIPLARDRTDPITSVMNGLSASYLSTIITVIKSVVNYAAKQGFDLNINTSFNIKHGEKKDIPVLTISNQKKLTDSLLKRCNTTNAGILLSLYMGIRIGELCALKWGDVNLIEGCICVRYTLQRLSCEGTITKTCPILTEPKSRDSCRKLPIPNFIIPILSSLKSDDDYYILSNTTKPTEPRVMQNRFRSLLKKEDIPLINYHALRHTFATRCVECGIDAKTLSKMLGHSSVRITLDKYVHPTDEQKRNSINKVVNEIYFGQNCGSDNV